MQYLINQDGTTYYFDPQATAVSSLQAGDVMASSSGQGLLRRVVTVFTTTDGLIAVETIDATLEDAIEEGTIAYTGKLTNADLQSSKALIKGVSLCAAMVASSTAFTIDINSVIYDGDGDYIPNIWKIKVN